MHAIFLKKGKIFENWAKMYKQNLKIFLKSVGD